jgi:hypothetical protein
LPSFCNLINSVKEKNKLEIYLNYKLLKQVNSVKYLGIIIDSKMTFKEHITDITGKCTKLIFTLSKSAKLNWGLGYAVLRTIYTGGYYLSSYTELQYGVRESRRLATSRR